MPKAICVETVVNVHGVYLASPRAQEVDEASLKARPDAFRLPEKGPRTAAENTRTATRATKPKPVRRAAKKKATGE